MKGENVESLDIQALDINAPLPDDLEDDFSDLDEVQVLPTPKSKTKDKVKEKKRAKKVKSKQLKE